MTRIDLNALTQWITAAAAAHPTTLAEHVAERTGQSRRSARRALARLVELQWLVDVGTARRPRHQPGALRQVVQRYSLDGLTEDLPWQRDFAPHFALPGPVQRLVQHAFSELVNNAIDHSGGTHLTVSLRQTASQAQLLVSDNGVGVFGRIAASFAIADPQLAMLELAKGKLTSQPDRHSGQGLFFTSKLADVFDLHANDAAFQQRAWDGRGWCPTRAVAKHGSSIYAAFLLDTPRTIDAVRQAFSHDGQGYGFDRTVVPLRLIASPTCGLESRAQAARVAARLGEFARAEIDFAGVPHIGHAFADELFRVAALRSGGRLGALVPVNASASIAALIQSVRGESRAANGAIAPG